MCVTAPYIFGVQNLLLTLSDPKKAKFRDKNPCAKICVFVSHEMTLPLVKA